jgi:hypothetical protein
MTKVMTIQHRSDKSDDNTSHRSMTKVMTIHHIDL